MYASIKSKYLASGLNEFKVFILFRLAGLGKTLLYL